MSTTALLDVIHNNWAVRREYEGPTGLEGPGPRGGWDGIVDIRCENQMKRSGLVLRPGEKVCVKCHTVKSVTGSCIC